MMKNPALVLIVNACIWGGVILMTSYTLKGTGAFAEIQHILGAGAAFSLLVVGAGAVRKKPRE